MNTQKLQGNKSSEFFPESGTDGLFFNEPVTEALVAARGSTIEIKTVNGKIYNGVFNAINDNGYLTVNQCGIVKPDGSNRITIDGHNLIMEADLVTMIFEPVKIASFTLENLNPSYTMKDKKPPVSYSNNGGKQFQLWRGDTSNNNVDMSLDDNSNGWTPEEMFSANRNSKKSTYDPKLSQYTTPLVEEDTAEYAKRKEAAAQKAREIEKSKEYNKNINREISDESEESKFSAVDRNDYSSNTYRSDPMRKNNRGGGKHTSYYQTSATMYNKVQRNMPPPQQQLDLKSVAKITRKVDSTTEPSDKFNRGPDSSRSTHPNDARNNKYSDRSTNNTKNYTYQQTSKQDDSGRYVAKDRTASNNNKIVQNSPKSDENKITSASKPQNVEPLADNDSKAKGDHVLAVNSNNMVNQNEFAKSTGSFPVKQPLAISRRKNSPPDENNKINKFKEFKAFNENFKLAPDNAPNYHLDNRASAPPPSTYKSPPNQQSHPSNVRQQLVNPSQHLVTKSNSYTHETGHYQPPQQHYPHQVYKAPSARSNHPGQWNAQQGYGQYAVPVNQPQTKPPAQQGTGQIMKEVQLVKKQPSINVPPINKSQPEKSPGVKTFIAASQYPPQQTSSSPQQSSTPPTVIKPQQPSSVEVSNLPQNDVTKVDVKEEKNHSVSSSSTTSQLESTTSSTSTLNPNAKEFKFKPTTPATAAKAQPAVTPVVQSVVPETSHQSGYPQQPQPMPTHMIVQNQQYRPAPIPHGPPTGYVALQPAPLPPTQQPQFIMDYQPGPYRNQQYPEIPGTIYSAPNFPPVHVPMAPPQPQQQVAQPPQPYMRTSSAQPQVMQQPPPQMMQVIQPHHHHSHHHHHQMVPQHAIGGQPVYTPTGQQQVMVVTRQHPGPPQGGMIQQGQSAPHPQPSPSAGSAYIAHQAAATMHHQMAPPQQPAGPPQQQYIQQPNISWPANNGGQSYQTTH